MLPTYFRHDNYRMKRFSPEINGGLGIMLVVDGLLPTVTVTCRQLPVTFRLDLSAVDGKVKIGKVDHSAEIAAEILGVHRDSFVREEFTDKLAVHLSDTLEIAFPGFPEQDRRTAENLGPQVLSLGPPGHHIVDQEFHGMDAVASRFRDVDRHVAGIAGVAQHEVVHADHFILRIVQAGGNTGTKQRRDHRDGSAGVVLSRINDDPFIFFVVFDFHSTQFTDNGRSLPVIFRTRFPASA